MSDDELITAVREQRNKVQMTTPAEQIISRGRVLRARRRIRGLAAALAVVAAAAFAVTAMLPASHHPGAQLAAWTVIKHSDGTVSVTIRELRDPAGLQRMLRADGVPASVTFYGKMNRSCRRYPANDALTARVFPITRNAQQSPFLLIDPSALPNGAGVTINPPARQPIILVQIGLVHTSPQCTGS